MEWSCGMENGMEQWTYTVAGKSCNWHCSVQVEQSSVYFLISKCLKCAKSDVGLQHLLAYLIWCSLRTWRSVFYHTKYWCSVYTLMQCGLSAPKLYSTSQHTQYGVYSTPLVLCPKHFYCSLMHFLYLPCLHAFWHAIPTSFYFVLSRATAHGRSNLKR